MSSTGLSAGSTLAVAPSVRAGFAAGSALRVVPAMRAGLAANSALAVLPGMRAGLAASGAHAVCVLMSTRGAAEITRIGRIVPFVSATERKSGYVKRKHLSRHRFRGKIIRSGCSPEYEIHRLTLIEVNVSGSS